MKRWTTLSLNMDGSIPLQPQLSAHLDTAADLCANKDNLRLWAAPRHATQVIRLAPRKNAAGL